PAADRPMVAACHVDPELRRADAERVVCVDLARTALRDEDPSVDEPPERRVDRRAVHAEHARDRFDRGYLAAVADGARDLGTDLAVEIDSLGRHGATLECLDIHVATSDPLTVTVGR